MTSEVAVTSPGLHASHAALASEQTRRRMLDHLMRLTRLKAKERVAHILLELCERLTGVGLAKDYRFPCPLSQEIFGDLVGLSAVHVNRSLQCCRRERLIKFTFGHVEILQPRRLAQLAQREV